MARIVITRPNGTTEYAALTTDKTQAGNDRLAVEKYGTVYYAKLDPKLSTHMFVIKPDGRKLYVQKEFKFVWEYDIDGVWENAEKIIIPRTGKYRLTYKRWDKSGADEKQTTESKDDIFEQGTKFNKSWYSFSIKAKSGKAYEDSYYWDNGLEEDENPDFESYTLQIKSIEYIGEA